MSSFDFPDSDGGLVTTSGGRYSGGGTGLPALVTVDQSSGALSLTTPGWVIMLVAAIFMLFVVILPAWGAYSSMTVSPKMLGRAGAGSNNLGFASALTGANMDIRKEGMESRSQQFFKEGRDSFLNAREQPYFPDVTNRVLRIENREKEAVRALGKINQERLRRAAADDMSTTPLPWAAFWEEWKKTHPIDVEYGYAGYDEEGFKSKDRAYLDAGDMVPY
jgi:hypothetical protein